MAGNDVLEALHQVATEIRGALDDLDDWGVAGTREGQYHSDIVADRVALEVLERAGLGVLSEESGLHHGEREIVVVVDPVDGSTNASRQLPWYATSLCALDSDGPVAAVVANQATGTRYEAVRGRGARCDGRPIGPTSARHMGDAIVAFSGYPDRHLGWSQFRSLGAAALDLCAVADGRLDAFIDCAEVSLAPWDYLGAVLICQEAGAHVGEAFGRDLVVRRLGPRRTIIAAATAALFDEVRAARVSLSPGGP